MVTFYFYFLTLLLNYFLLFCYSCFVIIYTFVAFNFFLQRGSLILASISRKPNGFPPGPTRLPLVGSYLGGGGGQEGGGAAGEDAQDGAQVGGPVPHCIITSLHHCLIASLPHCLTASLHHCLIASLPHCLTASLPHTCHSSLLPASSKSLISLLPHLTH